MTDRPRDANGPVLVFDSGLGGLSVMASLRRECAGARFVYVGDNAAFPYGGWQEGDLGLRIVEVMDQLIKAYRPVLAVIACNTASTLALEALRQAFDIPFVGTVPAIRVAARQSVSRIIGVLATPGTVKRGYTHDLISKFAADCEVVLCPAHELAAIAEAKLQGAEVDMDTIIREISPAFVTHGSKRTDAIVLACTHYPFLAKQLELAAPWPVHFIDPAPAIARQAARILEQAGPADLLPERALPKQDFAAFTGPLETPGPMTQLLESFGFSKIEIMSHALP